MNITIERDAFLGALQRVLGAVNRRSNVAALQHVAVRAVEAELHLTASNLDLQATTTCPARCDAPHTFTLPAHTVAEALTSFAAGAEVNLSRDGDDPRVILKCGRSRFKLPSLGVADIPVMTSPAGDTATITASDLAATLDGVAYAVGQEAVRPDFLGVRIVCERGRVECTASDNKRVAIAWSGAIGETGTALLPMGWVNEAVKLLDGAADAFLTITPTLAALKFGATELIGKVIEAQPIAYRRAIPQNPAYRVALDRDDLTAALRRALIMTDDKSHTLRFAFDADALSVTGGSGDTGEAANEIEIDWQGDPLTLGVNGMFMIDAISKLAGDTVTLEIASDRQPIVMQEDNRLASVGVLRG